MSNGNGLYDQFLDELKELDSFLVSRSKGSSRTAASEDDESEDEDEKETFLPLGRHDPDIRRLLEGMAYLSARTRVLAVQGLRGAVNRLNQGYFDFLLTALPTAALIQIEPNQDLEKSFVLPRETAIRIQTPEKAVGIFTTTRDLAVLPLRIKRLSATRLSKSCTRLKLRIDRVDLAAAAKKTLTVGVLSLRVNHNHDYLRSRMRLTLLERSLRQVAVLYDPKKGDDEASQPPCRYYFGSPEDPEVPEIDRRSHPLERIRSFFHFPAQALFLNVTFPEPPSSWSVAVICLDVDENWPTDLKLDDDMFQLFEVPVVNLRNDIAKPIYCDGTKEGYLVEGVNPAALGGVGELPGEAAELHSITGVYRKTLRGPIPLSSALLSNDDDTYEIEEEGDDPDHLERRLLLRIKDVFTRPVNIQVRGNWYQPGFDAVARTRLKVSLQRRSMPGISLVLAGDLEPHRPSPLWNDPQKLLHLLSLRSKTFLRREEVMGLLALLGADRRSYHVTALDLVASITSTEVPRGGRRADGVCHLYEIVFSPYEPEHQGLVDDLRREIQALLDAWLPGAVEVKATTASGSKLLPRHEESW